MLHEQLDSIETLIDKMENEDLSNLEKDTKDLKEYSSYAGTTPTEQEIITNSELITKAFVENNKIHRKLLEANAKIAESLDNLEQIAVDSDKRIANYQQKMKETSNQIIDKYKEKIINDADKGISSLTNKQQESFDDCKAELERIKSANENILNAQHFYAESLNKLAEKSHKKIRVFSAITCIVQLIAACAIAGGTCAAVFVSFTLIPKISEAIYWFWTFAGLFGFAIFGALSFVGYCAIKGRKNR